mgnify:CR=1 FL=1
MIKFLNYSHSNLSRTLEIQEVEAGLKTAAETVAAGVQEDCHHLRREALRAAVDLARTAARLMPISSAADAGKKVLCPMPGLVISIAVTEGQDVKAGETLAVIEAMKMQNVLRAEARVVVDELLADVGDVVAADQMLMTFVVESD